MRKLIVIVATLALIAALLGPWLTGRLAADVVQDNQYAIASALPDWLELIEADYQRSWFSATSRHRLLVTDAAPAGLRDALIGEGRFGDQPAIVMHSVIRHGPVVNLLTPAIAGIHSAFVVDDGLTPPRQLPVDLVATVGLTGNLTFDWQLGSGAISGERDSLRWSDTQVSHRIANGGRRTSIHLRMAELVRGSVDEMHNLALRDVDIETTLAQNDSTLDGRARYAFVAEHARRLDVKGTIQADELATSALPALIGLTRRSRVGNDSVAMLSQILRAPLALHWQQTIDSEQGVVQTNLQADFGATALLFPGADMEALLEQLMQHSTATLSVIADKQIVEVESTSFQELQLMRAAGYLQPDASTDTYRMQMIVADGAMTVNDLPVVLGSEPAR